MLTAEAVSEAPCLPSLEASDLQWHVDLRKDSTYALPLDSCFWGVKITAIVGGFRSILAGQHHQHNWADVSHFWTPQIPGVLDGCWMCGVKEMRGPNRPHDAHDAGSWGAAGQLKFVMNPNKTPLKIAAVGSVCSCEIPVLVGPALYDETGLACIAQAKPYKSCMLHGY